MSGNETVKTHLTPSKKGPRSSEDIAAQKWLKNNPFKNPHPEIGELKDVIAKCFEAEKRAREKNRELDLGPDTTKIAKMLLEHGEWVMKKDSFYPDAKRVEIFDQKALSQGKVRFLPVSTTH